MKTSLYRYIIYLILLAPVYWLLRVSDFSPNQAKMLALIIVFLGSLIFETRAGLRRMAMSPREGVVDEKK